MACTALPPSPWITRPPISMSMLLASAHTNRPISKTTMPTHAVYLRPNAMLIFPYSGAKHTIGSMYADVIHPTFENESNSALIVVKIVDMIV